MAGRAVDSDELVDFVRTDYPRVVAALEVVLGDRARAEDAVQEALAVALDHRRPIDDLAAWVYVAARNKGRSSLRRLGAEDRALRRVAARPDPVGRASEPVLDEHLLAGIRSLPIRQREIVVLHYLLDRSVADTAAALGVAEGTVKTQLHRARSTLRARFEGEASGNSEEGDPGPAADVRGARDQEEADHAGR